MVFGQVHSLGMWTAGNKEFRILAWSRSAYDNSMRDKNLDEVPHIHIFLQRRKFSQVGPIAADKRSKVLQYKTVASNKTYLSIYVCENNNDACWGSSPDRIFVGHTGRHLGTFMFLFMRVPVHKYLSVAEFELSGS